MEKIETFAKQHPGYLGLAVFAVGLLLLWIFGFFSASSSSASGGSLGAAYYQAVATQAAAGAAVQQTQSTNTAAVAAAKINADAAVAQTGIVTAGQTAQAQISSNDYEFGATQQTIQALAPVINGAVVQNGVSGDNHEITIAGLPGVNGNLSITAAPATAAGGRTPTELLAAGFSSSQIQSLYGFGS